MSFEESTLVLRFSIVILEGELLATNTGASLLPYNFIVIYQLDI